MRRKEKQITEQADVDDVIKGSRVCRLAMVDGNKPYVVPLNFGYAFPYLYFHSASEGRKLDVIRKNPHVCFEFDHLEKLIKNKEACEWGAAFKSVIGEGEAVLVTDIETKEKAMHCIMAQYSSRTFEFPRESLERTAVIQVKISEMIGKKSG